MRIFGTIGTYRGEVDQLRELVQGLKAHNARLEMRVAEWSTSATARPMTMRSSAAKPAALLRSFVTSFQVPSGFVLTTRAYREHIEYNGLAGDIERLVSDCQTLDAQQRAADEVRQLFESSQLPSEVEDTIGASFAGQQETSLWIVGGQAVLRHVLRCWASLFSPQAIAYRGRFLTPPGDGRGRAEHGCRGSGGRDDDAGSADRRSLDDHH